VSIEQRPNKSVALLCDRSGCHMEILGQNETEAREDANLIGWHALESGAKHTCKDCASGRNPAAVAVYGTDKATVDQSPATYAKGDAVHDPNGDLVGYAEHDAKAGDPLDIALVAPGQDAPEVSTATTPVPHAGGQYDDGLSAEERDLENDLDEFDAALDEFANGDDAPEVPGEGGPVVAPPVSDDEAAKTAKLFEDVDDLFSDSTWDPDA